MNCKNNNLLLLTTISEGIYTENDTHLFELTLTDLEEEYNKIRDK
ncbi:MAG: Fur-regulated basic protein FbpA [Bacillota bacterium]